MPKPPHKEQQLLTILLYTSILLTILSITAMTAKYTTIVEAGKIKGTLKTQSTTTTNNNTASPKRITKLKLYKIPPTIHTIDTTLLLPGTDITKNDLFFSLPDTLDETAYLYLEKVTTLPTDGTIRYELEDEWQPLTINDTIITGEHGGSIYIYCTPSQSPFIWKDSYNTQIPLLKENTIYIQPNFSWQDVEDKKLNFYGYLLAIEEEEQDAANLFLTHFSNSSIEK